MILFNTLFCFIMIFILLHCLQCWSTPRCKVLRHVFKPSALLSWWDGQEILSVNLCIDMKSRETNPIKIVKSRNRDWPFIVHWIFQLALHYCSVFTLVKEIVFNEVVSPTANPWKEAIMWNIAKKSPEVDQIPRKKVVQGAWGRCSVSSNWNCSTSWKKDGNTSSSSSVFKQFYPTVWDFQFGQIFKFQTSVGKWKHSQFKKCWGPCSSFWACSGGRPAAPLESGIPKTIK